MLYDSPRTYELLFADRQDDVRYYRALARGHAAVLEYGVGAGRIAVPVARDGVDVVGVDASRPMLDALARRLAGEGAEVRARVQAVEGDMRAWRTAARFSLITCPFNGVAHLYSREDLGAFFARVREHLAPGGLFAFDTWLPDPSLLAGTRIESPRFTHPDSGEAVTLREDFAYDPYAQVLTVTLTITPALRPEGREVRTITQRQLFPEETRILLDAQGFDVRWRTSAFRAPASLDGASLDLEPGDGRGELLAYVCALK